MKRGFWEKPWSYKESFTISIGLLFIGILLDYLSPTNPEISLRWPINLYFGIGFTVFIISIRQIFLKSAFIRWSSSIPAALSAIIMFLVSGLIMGLVSQGVESESTLINRLGFNQVTNTWTYILIQLYFIFTLMMVVQKRFRPFNRRNIAFALSHIGLLLALFSATLGSGDMVRLNMYLQEGSNTWTAYSENGDEFELDFALFLKDFEIEEYDPKLAIVDKKLGNIIHGDGKNIYHINKGKSGIIDNYYFEVLEYYYESGIIGERYAPANEPGAVPSAKVKIWNETDTVIDWVSCGNFMYPQMRLDFDSTYAFHMLPPMPKKYSSSIHFETKQGKSGDIILEVNKPYDLNGWKIYQVSYVEGRGRWSDKSQLELIKDPWLPIVYIGIFLMIAGALFLFWTGNQINNKQKD